MPYVSLWTLNLLFGLVIAALLVSYVWQRRKIWALTRELLKGEIHPGMGTRIHRKVSLTLAGWVYSDVAFTLKDPLFVPIPGLRWLGASPVRVSNAGGCCSGKSRLLTCLLRSAGQHAYQVSVYHSSGVARHVLVASSMFGDEILLDPLYGIHYTGPEGQSFGLGDLRAGVPHGYASLPGSEEKSYPDDEYYDFIFPETRTAGWTATRLHRAAYAMLNLLTRGGIDTYPQRGWMEWPQLLLAVALLLLCAGVNVIAFLVP